MSRQDATNEAVQRARFALDHDRAAEAERLAEEILKSNADNRDAIKTLGYALIMQSRAREAVKHLEKAARGSQDAELETELAIALQCCDRNDDAVTWLERAVKRKPPFPTAFLQLGLALARLHRFNEAIVALKRGIEAAPMMIDMQVVLGEVYASAGDRPTAGACFKRVLTMDPGHPRANLALADLLMAQREFTQAADSYRRALQQNPSNHQVRLSLANCLLSLGKPDDALSWMRSAATAAPQLYGKALRTLAASNRGRFWLRPSTAAKKLRGKAEPH
jgi:tetratricopeptide (TPR) repeat protein